jgi:hypothetical protein
MFDDYYTDLCDKDKAKELIDALSVSLKTPVGQKALEYIKWLCRYDSPDFSTDPNVALMEKAKREVYLTLQTLLQDDVNPEQIAEYYKRQGGING